MNVSKLSPAPWKPIDKIGWSGLETSDGEDLLLFATCVGDWHGRVEWNSETDRDFVALARNAFAGDPEALAWWEANRTRPAV